MRRFARHTAPRALHRAASTAAALPWYAASQVPQLGPECTHRVVAIGDVHGDITRLHGALAHAGVIDPENGHKWVGGEATVVQLGDLLDRGPDDKAIMDYVEVLRDGAAAAGGKLVTLIGNHEMMNITADLRYVWPESMENWGGKQAHGNAFMVGGEYCRRIAENYQLIHAELDTAFVHAGLRINHAIHGVDAINAFAKAVILDQPASEDLPQRTLMALVWDRDVAHGNVSAAEVELVLKALNVDQLVLGHTPQEDGTMKVAYDGMVVLADTAMSRGMCGNLPMFYQVSKAVDGKVDRRSSRMTGDVWARFIKEFHPGCPLAKGESSKED